jgi:hypothetical protein
MDSSTQFGMDNRLGRGCFFYGGLSIFTFGPLLGLLGAEESGTQCGILVLSRRYRDCGFGVAGPDDTCSLFVPNWSGRYRFVDSYPARPSSRDHLVVSMLWSQTHNQSSADALLLIRLPKLLRTGSSPQPRSPVSVIAFRRPGDAGVKPGTDPTRSLRVRDDWGLASREEAPPRKRLR